MAEWYEAIPQDRMRCIVQNARTACKRYYHCHALWTLVSHVFGVGSRTAMNICKFAGLDPHEEVKPSSTGIKNT